jgi:2-polyprenyl-3-methyl-5-hydroxy-6-metoxy-1,4-benzoquinol methylase
MRIAELIRIQLNRKRPPRLLEIGFGDGHLTELIRREVDECWGIEPDQWLFERAMNRLQLDRDKSFPIRAEELDTYPAFAAQASAFDAIVMVSVFEHLSNPAAILRSCSRLLRPRGILVVSTPDSKYFRELRALRRIAGMEPWGYDHISFFTEENLEKAFDRHNLVVKERSYRPLVTPESIRFFRELTNSRAISAAMRIFMITGLDRALRIHTLLYVLQKGNDDG